MGWGCPMGFGGGLQPPLGPQTAPRWVLGCCRALRGGRISHQSPPVPPSSSQFSSRWGQVRLPAGGGGASFPILPPWLGTAPPAPSHPLQPTPAPLLPPFPFGLSLSPRLPDASQFSPVQPSAAQSRPAGAAGSSPCFRAAEARRRLALACG